MDQRSEGDSNGLDQAVAHAHAGHAPTEMALSLDGAADRLAIDALGLLGIPRMFGRPGCRYHIFFP